MNSCDMNKISIGNILNLYNEIFMEGDYWNECFNVI